MTTDLLSRARAGDGEAFGQLVDPYRRELHASTLPRFGLPPTLPG